MTKQQKIDLLLNTLEILDVTQTWLGEAIGVDQSKISLMTRGRRPILLRHELALECMLRRMNQWPVSAARRRRLAANRRRR